MARLVVGIPFVLVAPGLAWSFVFFPRVRRLDAPREEPGLDWMERGAIAVGLSIVLVPTALFFLVTFAGLRVTGLNATLLVLGLTGGAGATWYVRRRPARAD